MSDGEREQVLAEGAWAAHCWVHYRALDGTLCSMPPSDVSAGVSRAIEAAKRKERPGHE